MDSASRCHSKSWRTRLVVILTMILLTVLVSRCEPPWKDSPYTIASACWVSTDPRLEFSYEHDEAGVLTRSGVLYCDGEAMNVQYDFRGGAFYITRIVKGVTETIMMGSWRYRSDREQIVFSVQHDEIFNGAYTEIVFERVS